MEIYVPLFNLKSLGNLTDIQKHLNQHKSSVIFISRFESDQK